MARTPHPSPHLMVLLHFGDMPKETVLYNTTRFAQEVMPRLRPIWNEWHDQWWPHDTLAQLAEPASLPTPMTV